jgi:hypothetical protein
MTPHPRAVDLETLAAGDLLPEAAVHVASCGACARYVGGLREAAARFARQADPAKFAELIERRARTELAERRSKAPLRIVFAGLPVLAAAAVLVLLLSGRAHDTTAHVDAASSSASVDREGAASSSVSVDPEGVRFKGRLPIAAIRQRGTKQARFVGKVPVRPLDGLRLELALDSEQVISAGLLQEDGSWVELISPRTLEPGTHFSEQAARFDQHPARGFLVAGEPAAVERARRTRIFEQVSVLEVEVEP